MQATRKHTVQRVPDARFLPLNNYSKQPVYLAGSAFLLLNLALLIMVDIGGHNLQIKIYYYFNTSGAR